MFDLLTALLDSWTLWNRVAGSDDVGLAWRRVYLTLTYDAGAYSPYEDLIREAARQAGVDGARADALIARWGELEPWPEAPRVVRELRANGLRIGVATNSSVALAKIAVACVGAPVDAVVTAEEAGYYKPRPEPYRLALQRLGVEAHDTLFVAGSAADVPGASAVGMPVFWHNRMRLPAADRRVTPLRVADSLEPLVDVVLRHAGR